MQQPKNTLRLLRALAKQGLDVSYDDSVYTIRLNNCQDTAEVLLPPDFPIEGKAFQQLAGLTNSHLAPIYMY
jgi:tRNA-splicing ligase RtcB (3'-phosphate/5'-hydroxy nucleic acid ligase)